MTEQDRMKAALQSERVYEAERLQFRFMKDAEQWKRISFFISAFAAGMLIYIIVLKVAIK